MEEFSIQEAAFTGFRLVREHPRALVAWALYALVFAMALVAVFVGLAGRDMADFLALGGAGANHPEETLKVFARLAPAYFAALALILAANAVIGAAMIRAVLRPLDDRFGFLRLGVQELRQVILGVMSAIVLLGAYIGVTVVIGALSAMAGLGMPATFLLLLAGAGTVVTFLGVRLSLAPALTFDRGKVDLFGSWALTRGRFWTLLGTYALTLALILVIYALCSLMIYAVGAIVHGGDLEASAVRPDFTSLAAYLTPWTIIQTLLDALVSALVWPVMFTPPSAIYRVLVPSSFGVVDVFS